jgi:hypothetical protein
MPNDLVTFRAQNIDGIDERWLPPPNAAARLQDARWDPLGGWAECGGFGPILEDVTPQGGGPAVPAFTGQGKVHSMHWSSRHNGGLQDLIWEMGTDLVRFDGPNLSWEVLATGRYVTDQPWQRTQYRSVANNTWIINGENEPLRWDGRRMHTAGFASPPPIVTAAGRQDGFTHGTTYQNIGLGTTPTDIAVGTGEYVYAITDVNEFGTESPPSPLSGVVKWQVDAISFGDVGGKYMVAVDIPASRTAAVARKLYRSRDMSNGELSYGTELYLVGWITARDRFIYIDAKPDAYLGPALDVSRFGCWPRGAKYLEVWQGTFWVAGMSEYPDQVSFSAPLQFENFPVGNFFPVGDSDSGEVTGLYAGKDALIVFKRRGIYKIVGNPVNGFNVETLWKNVGCAAPNSVCDIPGIGIVFATDTGVYALTSTVGDATRLTEPMALGMPIQDTWRTRVNVGALMNAFGVLYHDDKEYHLYVPVDGQPDNSFVFVFHWEKRTWTTRPLGFPMSCGVESRDHRGLLFLGSHDNAGHPGVHVYSHGWPDKDGVDIAFLYETVPLDFGGRYDQVQIKTLQLFVVSYGNNDVSIRYRKDRRSTYEDATSRRRDAQDAQSNLAVWDDATWSASSTWVRQHPVPVRVDPNITGREFQFQVTAVNRVQLVDWELGIVPKGERTIRALNIAIGTGTPGNS